MKVASKGSMSGEKANNNIGLCSVKEHKSRLVVRPGPEISFRACH